MVGDNLYDYIGRWIFYNWMHNCDPVDLLHPDIPLHELDGIDIGLCFCIGVEEGYLILKTQHGIFNMKPWEKIDVLLPSVFFWGDHVKVVSNQRVQGVIDLILWDRKDKAYRYTVFVNNKTQSRHYKSSELALCEEH